MRARLLIALLAAGTAGVACSDSTGSQNSDRIYTLDNIDGTPPPGVVSVFGISGVVQSASLTLRFDGRATWFERVPTDAGTGGDSTIAAQVEYQIHGDSIRLALPGCRGTCIPDDVGAISDTSLTLTYDVTPRFTPIYHFSRIRTDPH